MLLNRYKVFAVVVTSLILLPLMSLAHLSGGQDAVVGNYTIDFGYEPSELRVNSATTVALNLIKSGSEQSVNFTSLWLRISQNNEILFAGTLGATLPGNSTFSYVWPRPGEYVVTSRFEVPEQEPIEYDFHLQVESPPPAVYSQPWEERYMGISSAITFIIVVFAFVRWCHKRK